MEEIGFQNVGAAKARDWTPLEIDEKYIDQSHYIDDECSYVQVREVYTLPDGDLMLGYLMYLNGRIYLTGNHI